MNQAHSKPALAADDSNPGQIKVVDLYAAQERIHPRAVQGRFDRLRKVLRWLLLAVLVLVPWLRWQGHQAVLVDLDARRLHLFDLQVFPQDITLAAGLLIVGALALFAVTAWVGRVWCGYACPQSVWSAIFFGIEQRLEGRPAQRHKLDAAPWGPRKIGLRLAKYSLFLLVSLVTAFSICAWFNPADQLLRDLFTLNLSGGVAFWMLFFTAGTWLAGGVLREQVCFYMCPYARFQAAMFDSDTLVISYNPQRGEPRGPGRRTASTSAKGDCIDCSLCVQVCPSGIDIRDGLQYQCISCGLCIDACDQVMDQIGKPRGLIRYTTERALAGIEKAGWHPKLLGYTAALAAACLVMLVLMVQRPELQLDVFRDRQQLYRTLAGANGPEVENTFRLRLTNMTAVSQDLGVGVMAVDGALPLTLLGPATVHVPAGGLEDLVVRVRMPLQPAPGSDPAVGPGTGSVAAKSGPGALSVPVLFTVTNLADQAKQTSHEARLLLPMAGGQ